MKNPAEFYTLKSKKSAQTMGSTSDIYDDVLEESGYPRNGYSALEKKGMMERFLEYKNNHYNILAIKSRVVKPPFHFLSEPTKAIIEKLCMHIYIAYTVTIKHFGQSSLF